MVGWQGWRWQKEEGNGNARKGFLGFLQRRSGSLAEVGARGANRRRVSGCPWVGGWVVGGRKGGRVAEQLCLEVAPSILIDFICAHVSESEAVRGL